MGVKIDQGKKIIERTVSGGLYTERSLKLVRELALAVTRTKGIMS